MKTKLLLAVGGGLIVVAICSCGGGSGNGGYGENGNVTVDNPAAVEPQTLSVQQVLALAQQPSDTGEPLVIDNNQTMITPQDDDTSDPETL